MPAPTPIPQNVLDTFNLFLLASNRAWSGPVTFGFVTSGSNFAGYPAGSAPFSPSFAPLDAHEQAQIRLAMQAWDLAFRPDITEVTEPGQVAQIRFGFTTNSLSFTGRPPLGSEQPVDGDVWLGQFDPRQFDTLDPVTQYGNLLFRIGEALGLQDLFGVGSGGLAPYVGGHFSVMYGGGINDNVRWLVDPNGPNGPRVVDEVVVPTTPMVIDDYALMTRYGAPVANPGDTTYTWSPDHALMMTVIDSGGNDTFDLSNHTRPSLIDLRPASYSSIDIYAADQQLADLTALYPSLGSELAQRFGQNQTYTGSQNLGIAFGTIIENARAGSGDDTIIGNDAANGLFGGDGSDSISGGDGADWIDGGAGANTLDGGAGQDTLSYAASKVGVSVDLAAQTSSAHDVLSGFENAVGSNLADTLNGSSGANSLSAGAGDDQIFGKAGDDTIDGGEGQNYLRGDEGDDSIAGGAGFDDANGNMGNDTVHGNGGDDYSVGGKDNDVLFGDAGDDIVWGNLGNDTCDGGDGNDQVRGGQGDDVVNGGAGNDFVSGDRGNDTITGGAGADLFHGSQDAGIDRVLDFSVAEGDRVQLDPGTTYTLSQVGADTVLDMGGGNQMILVGVPMSSLTTSSIFLG